MPNTAVRRFERHCQELSDFIVKIDDLDECSEAEQKFLLEQRIFLLTYFDKLIHERIDNIKNISKFDQNLERTLRLFYTDIQLIFQCVKEFYMREQEQIGNTWLAADSQRVYALLVHCVNKQQCLLSKIQRAI